MGLAAGSMTVGGPFSIYASYVMRLFAFWWIPGSTAICFGKVVWAMVQLFPEN
jgi:hypothetical protein